MAQMTKSIEHLPWFSIARWLTGLLCIGAVIAVVLNISDLEHLLAVIQGIEPRWLLLAVVTQALTYVAGAGVWHQVLRAAARPAPFLVLYRLSLAQLFAEQALPSSGLSGALLVMKGLVNRGIDETIGMGCMLVGMISYYGAYVTAIIASFVILISTNGLRDPNMLVLITPLIVIASLFGLLMAGVLSTVFWLRRRGKEAVIPAWLRPWLRHWPSLEAILNRVLYILAEAPAPLLRNRPLLIKAGLLQLTVFLIDAMTFSIMLRAIGADLSYQVTFASFVLASVVGSVLPIPLGLGTFEGSCVALLHLFQLPVATALVGVLLLRGFTFWLPMVPGLLLARHELNATPADQSGQSG